MRKFLGVLFTILLVFPLFLSTLVLYSLSTWVMDRDLYIKVFSSEEMQTKLFSDEIIAEMVTKNLGEIEGLDTVALGSLFRSVIPEQYYKDQVTNMVNQIFDFLERKSDTLTLQIDLSEIKAAFSGPNQQVLLEELASVLPSCQDTQATQGLGVTLCKPTAVSEEVFVEYYLKTNLPVLLARMQDNVTILGPISMSDQFQNMPSVFQPFLNLESLKTAIVIFAGIAILIWILTALIAGKNGKERLLWLGWTLFLPSLLVLILGLIANSTLAWNMLQYGMDQFNMLKAGNLIFSTQQILQTLQTLFANQISSSFILTGGFCSAIGLGFIAWGAVTHASKTQKKEE